MIELDGRRIETAWWGDRAAPTLVLLHEGLGSVGLWRDWPARLAAATGCGVFAYSRAGHGRSAPAARPRPLDYMQAEAMAVLPRVLDAAGIGRAVLVGHSDGGTIAVLHAARHADPRIAALVLIAPHVVVEPVTVAAIRAIHARYATGDLRARLARHHDDPDGVFLGWAEAWLDPGFPQALDLRPDLARLRRPMLVVQGEADPYGTLQQVRLLQDLAPARVEALRLPGIGHAPHVEAGPLVLAATADAVRRAVLHYNAGIGCGPR